MYKICFLNTDKMVPKLNLLYFTKHNVFVTFNCQVKIISIDKHIITDPNSGHSTAAGQIARLIAFSPSYFAIKHENVKVKVKYGFDLQDLQFYVRIVTSYLKMSGMPC